MGSALSAPFCSWRPFLVCLVDAWVLWARSRSRQAKQWLTVEHHQGTGCSWLVPRYLGTQGLEVGLGLQLGACWLASLPRVTPPKEKVLDYMPKSTYEPRDCIQGLYPGIQVASR